jgi:MFS family permease
MTVTCLTGSIIANRFGLKNTLIFGTTGYVLYSAALYTNNRYGTQWFIYFGSAACGVTAGLFWAAEGAIMLSYPEPHNRGKYLSYWLCYRNSGSILGGIINLAFNAKGRKTGKLDWRTYIVFVVLRECSHSMMMRANY